MAAARLGGSAEIALALKEEGNKAFKEQNYLLAQDLYSKAITEQAKVAENDSMAVLLCNRAAVHLKRENYPACVTDCDVAITIVPDLAKAFYRRAQANSALGDLSKAYSDLNLLIRMDPKKADAIALMRTVKAAMDEQRSGAAEIKRILKSLKEEKNTPDCLKGLISLLSEEKHYTMDFVRNGGNELLGGFISNMMKKIDEKNNKNNSDISSSGNNNNTNNSSSNGIAADKSLTNQSEDLMLLSLGVRVIAAASSHEEYVRGWIHFNGDSSVTAAANNQSTAAAAAAAAAAAINNNISTNDLRTPDNKFIFESLCHLLHHTDSGVSHAAFSCLMRILKSLPLSKNLNFALPDDISNSLADQGQALLELLAPKTPESGVNNDNNENKDNNDDKEIKEIKESLPGIKSKPKAAQVPDPEPFLTECSSRIFLRNLISAINKYNDLKKLENTTIGQNKKNTKTEKEKNEKKEKKEKDNDDYIDLIYVALDALSAFISESPDYFGKIIAESTDIRLESLQLRKARQLRFRVLRNRAKRHAKWAIQEGVLPALLQYVEGDSILRQQIAIALARLVAVFDSTDEMKGLLSPYFEGSFSRVEEVMSDSRVTELEDDMEFPEDIPEAKSMGPQRVYSHPPVDVCRRRAALTVALFTAHADLGVWALELPGGVPQLLILVASGEKRCLEVSSEVMCQAASCEKGAILLAPVLTVRALQPLLTAPSHAIRSAAVATVSKLSIKANTLREESDEISVILNTVTSVLKAAAAGGDGGVDEELSELAHGQLTSFSSMYLTAQAKTKNSKNSSSVNNKNKDKNTTSDAALFSSIERSIEVLAGLVGRSHVKEEIVHGSYRVAASVPLLLSLALDLPVHCVTASYGMAHILCALTVTNYELKTKALADKGMTAEQYDKLNNMQRIKPKNDDNDEPHPMAEEPEPSDPDTLELCRQRIVKIVASGGIPILSKLLTHTSPQTSGSAARALRQICVVEHSRGVMAQQGGLKACCAAASDENIPKEARREATHAVAKTLVSVNPHSLTEHTRLGALVPLIALCRDIDASNLQQFESCLAITNLVSCGEVEQEKLATEGGVSVLYTLVCSDHKMVRRAAMEVFCNMPLHELVLKMLRSDKMKLWLAICEEGVMPSEAEIVGEGEEVLEDVEEEEDEEDDCMSDEKEAYNASRAAAGVLAVATSDDTVCDSILKSSNFVNSIMALLQSMKVELVHRVLVVVSNMLTVEDDKNRQLTALSLCESNLLPVMGNIIERLQGVEEVHARIGALAIEIVQKITLMMNTV